MTKRRAGVGLDIVVDPTRAEAALWRRLRFEDEGLCREALFNRYRPLARTIARRQAGLRPANGSDGRDLEQFAYQGLLEAIDRYDPLRAVPFGAYARRRMIGCIADGAARMNEIDAQHSHRRRLEAERLRSLSAAGDDGPLRQLADLAAGLALGLILEGTNLIEPEGGADHRPNAYDSLAWRELQSVLARAVGDLPDREGIIIRQHYENGLSFARIAELLGVSRGRVSQLHRAAIARLRARVSTQSGD